MQYIVKNFNAYHNCKSEEKKGMKPEVCVVSEDEIFKILDDAKVHGDKISVYRIGECIIDWS